MINTRSGTRIAVSDTSIQDGVDRVYPPVLVGLEQALFFTAGGDGKNYAPDGVVLPTITGTPTQNAYSKSFPTINDCIDTGLVDNTDYTVLIVNKPTAMPQGKTFRPFLGTGMLRPLSLEKEAVWGVQWCRVLASNFRWLYPPCRLLMHRTRTRLPVSRKTLISSGWDITTGHGALVRCVLQAVSIILKTSQKELLKNQRH